MAFEEFLAEVKTKGLAKNNRFGVAFNGANFAGFNPARYRSAMLLCDGAQIPGVSYATVPNRTFGEMRETPYDRLYEPVNLSFYVDKEMQVKYLFDKWMDAIQNPATRKFNYYKDYVVDMAIEVFDTQNQTRYIAAFYEAYPKAISSVQLDSANKDIMKLNVTMQYKFWTSEPRTVFDAAAGEPISPNVVSIYNSDFYGFQEAYTRFNQASSNVSSNVLGRVTDQFPGFDGGLPDIGGFLTTTNSAINEFTTGIGSRLPKLPNLSGSQFPRLSEILNLV
jgi:hypothetical protein